MWWKFKAHPWVLTTGDVLLLVFAIRFSASQEVPEALLFLVMWKYKFIYLILPIIKKAKWGWMSCKGLHISRLLLADIMHCCHTDNKDIRSVPHTLLHWATQEETQQPPRWLIKNMVFGAPALCPQHFPWAFTVPFWKYRRHVPGSKWQHSGYERARLQVTIFDLGKKGNFFCWRNWFSSTELTRRICVCISCTSVSQLPWLTPSMDEGGLKKSPGMSLWGTVLMQGRAGQSHSRVTNQA